MKPILFSTLMVQAILEGRKTMTRRKIKPKQEPFIQDENCIIELNKTWGWVVKRKIQTRPTRWEILQQFKCPYGNVGDVLWVRETVCNAGTDEKPYFLWKADGCIPRDKTKKWKPSIFMPKVACRLFLEITDVRVERLQDISEGDAISEGIEIHEGFRSKMYKKYPGRSATSSPIDSFGSLWQSINGNWNSNPFVWVVGFKRVYRPHEPPENCINKINPGISPDIKI